MDKSESARRENAPKRKWHSMSDFEWVFCFFVGSAVSFMCYTAMPGHSSRIPVNEETAATMLNRYVSAQHEYINSGNSPAAGYSLLHYGLDGNGNAINLIPKAMADAAVAAGEEHDPYQGYRFCDATSNRVAQPDEASRFALMAFPERYGLTGTRILRIDAQGGLYSAKPDLPLGTTAEEQARMFRDDSLATPASGASPLSWETFDPEWQKWNREFWPSFPGYAGMALLFLAFLFIARGLDRRQQ